MMSVLSLTESMRAMLTIRSVGLVAGLVLLVASGCVESRARYTPVPADPTATSVPMPTATATPEPTATPTATATPEPTATAVPPIPTPTATPVPTAIPEPTATFVPGSGTFNVALDFEGIGDESIVYSDTVLLRGQASADAVVSVNGVIVEVQADGTFELTLVLDPGGNFVDVVASNLAGSVFSSSLAIISIPPEDESP